VSHKTFGLMSVQMVDEAHLAELVLGRYCDIAWGAAQARKLFRLVSVQVVFVWLELL